MEKEKQKQARLESLQRRLEKKQAAEKLEGLYKDIKKGKKMKNKRGHELEIMSPKVRDGRVKVKIKDAGKLGEGLWIRLDGWEE